MIVCALRKLTRLVLSMTSWETTTRGQISGKRNYARLNDDDKFRRSGFYDALGVAQTSVTYIKEFCGLLLRNSETGKFADFE